MATISEDYVSFEIAKLLKEKGFPQNPNICNTAYTHKGKLSNNAKSFAHNFTEFDKLGIIPRTYSIAPTIQMAMKWLREVHHIAINIGWGEIFEDKFQWWCIILNYKDGNILRESEYYATYEQAVEAAIKYCLENLI